MQWKLDPVGGLYVAIAAALLLVVVPWLFAPRGTTAPTGRKRWILLGLRAAASLLLLVAWLRPAVVWTQSEPLRETLLLLADSSRSMSVEDSLGGEPRYTSIRRLLDASSDAVRQVNAQHGLRAYHFGEAIDEVPVDETGRVALPQAPAGKQTAIGSAINKLLQESSNERLMGVVLLSDGAQRAVAPHDLAPLTAAQRLAAEGVPLYTFAFGDRASQNRADLAVEDLVVAERAFAGAPLRVGASLRVAGYPNRQARVQLLWEEERGRAPAIVDSALVNLLPGINAHPIVLTHTPMTAGEWKLTVRAEPLDGETLTDNNTLSTFVTVREGGIRVLYLAGATRVGGSPGWEQRFVRASLAASPDIAVTRPEQPLDYRPALRDLTPLLRQGGVDVFVLDDLDADALDRPTWNRIAELVEEGAGLAMLGGWHSFGPGGHRSTPMEALLPIVMGRSERQAFDQPMRAELHLQPPVRVVPTDPVGKNHPIMQLGSAARWSELPPLEGANRFDRRRLKPNARVLAEASNRERSPLIVSGQPGVGRVLAVGTDSTYRWVLEGQGEAHRRFWRQVILWLAKQEEDSASPVRIELSSRRVVPGGRIDVAASVRMPEKPAAGNLSEKTTESVRYEAKIRTPNGEELPLRLPNQSQRATTAFRQTSQPGDYLVSVRALAGERSLGTAQARFLVPEQDLELDRPAADPQALARLAEVTAAAGGKGLAPEELPELLKQLAERKTEARQQVVARYTPWDTWPFLLALVTALSIEWWLRRKWGMP